MILETTTFLMVSAAALVLVAIVIGFKFYSESKRRS